MLRAIAKPFLWLCTSAMPVVLAACYGPRYEEGGLAVSGRVKDRDSGAGVGDIRVTCLLVDDSVTHELDQTTTLEGDGSFSFEPGACEACNALRFEDVDGAANGSYTVRTLPIDPAEAETSEDLDVELYPEG